MQPAREGRPVRTDPPTSGSELTAHLDHQRAPARHNRHADLIREAVDGVIGE